MRIKDIMSRTFEVVYLDTPLKKAAEKLSGLEAEFVPVLEDDRLVGVLYKKDMNAPWERVKDVVSTEMSYCFEDESPDSALKVMEERGLHRLMVLTRDRRLVGILSYSQLSSLMETHRAPEKAFSPAGAVMAAAMVCFGFTSAFAMLTNIETVYVPVKKPQPVVVNREVPVVVARSTDTLSATDQSNNTGDIEITQKIRKSIVNDDTLSLAAQNVKIITIDGRVTLRGLVKDKKEREIIGLKARQIAGDEMVDNQLEFE